MGLKYLWDTNTIIYYLQKNFSDTDQDLISNIITNHPPAISAITQIELLCWKAATEKDLTIVQNFISDCVVFELEIEVKIKTVEIRKAYGLKLPDAIIAATAIVMDLTLISNDKKDFSKVPALKILNPVKTA